MKERKRVAEATAGRYRRERKREKTAILNQFVELTGFARSYAALVLRNHGRVVQVNPKLRVRGDVGKRLRRPGRRPDYDEPVVKGLIKVWRIMDYICGKRLAPVLAEIVERLQRRGELKCDPEVRKKLSRMSAATIDRLLREERQKYQLKGRAHTRPGTLLKHQIPLRTFSEWDEQRPGFLEIDLVGHDGGTIDSLHGFTLDAVDIATAWVSLAALKNKAQVWTFAGLQEIRAKLPFPLLGIDSDNGSEFINESFFRYCQDEKITFTRSRPYRKNDSCFVEQKNYSVVRRAVGYQRCDTDEQVRLLAALYQPLELYTNFFQPSMKLKSKERHGARVTKKYDKARTPYQRVLESGFIDEVTKEQLRQRYESLNPAQLKRQIERLQRKLLATAASPKRNRQRLATKRRAAQRPAVEMPRLRKATKSVASLSRLEKSAQKAA
jgi:hypothetical protein